MWDYHARERRFVSELSFKNQVSIKSRIYAEVTLRPAPPCEGAACERCREGKFTQLSGELQKERGKFQSRQLSLLTHFNLGKPDVRLPTRDFVGRCKGWSVLETDVSPPPPPRRRPSERDMDAINITGCIHNRVIVPGFSARLEFNATARR